MNRILPVTIAAALLCAAGTLPAAPHPHYDDGGAVNWKASWALALATAKQTGKPIFIDAGIEN